MNRNSANTSTRTGAKSNHRSPPARILLLTMMGITTVVLLLVLPVVVASQQQQQEQQQQLRRQETIMENIHYTRELDENLNLEATQPNDDDDDEQLLGEQQKDEMEDESKVETVDDDTVEEGDDSIEEDVAEEEEFETVNEEEINQQASVEEKSEQAETEDGASQTKTSKAETNESDDGLDQEELNDDNDNDGAGAADDGIPVDGQEEEEELFDDNISQEVEKENVEYQPTDDDPIVAEDQVIVENVEEELAKQEKVARTAGGLGIFIAIGAMIFTAHQMSENPDGIYASVCRLAITICGVVIKLICMPCRKVIGAGTPHYTGHMPISTSDYGYRGNDAGFELP